MKNNYSLQTMFLMFCVFIVFVVTPCPILAQEYDDEDCIDAPGYPNGGFENTTNCSLATSNCFTRAFNQGCITGWSAANGSPDACWSFGSTVAPFEGELMAAMGSRWIGNDCKNEAIVTNVFLNPTKRYRLSFFHRTATYASISESVDIDVFLTSGLSNVISSDLDLSLIHI